MYYMQRGSVTVLYKNWILWSDYFRNILRPGLVGNKKSRAGTWRIVIRNMHTTKIYKVREILTHFGWWRSSLRTSAPRRGRKLITNISKQYTIIFWWKKIGNASNRASTRRSSRGINWRARVNKAWKMEAHFSSALKETPLREKILYSSPIYLNIFSRTFAKGN